MNTFKKERAFYFANKAKLLSLFHGKWLIIKGKRLMSVAGNMYNAYDQIHILQSFYEGPPIMMHQCLYNEPCMGIPSGLTWLDDVGNPVSPDPRDLIAYEEGTRIKFAPDSFTGKQFDTLKNIWNNIHGVNKE